ncbi:hypothetical protein, partial [Mangrovicoccus sp. HB161399]|uniref:hypothetical protein n=1 Tax=Mangrovicoccus sp. HB161399 TaxID=2720392 RepID=UPI001C130D50
MQNRAASGRHLEPTSISTAISATTSVHHLLNGSEKGDVTVSLDGTSFIISAIINTVGSCPFIQAIFPTVSPALGRVPRVLRYCHRTASDLYHRHRHHRQLPDPNLRLARPRTLADAVGNNCQASSVLPQASSISNDVYVARSFNLDRYRADDLYLPDETRADGGGVASMAGTARPTRPIWRETRFSSLTLPPGFRTWPIFTIPPLRRPCRSLPARASG